MKSTAQSACHCYIVFISGVTKSRRFIDQTKYIDLISTEYSRPTYIGFGENRQLREKNSCLPERVPFGG